MSKRWTLWSGSAAFAAICAAVIVSCSTPDSTAPSTRSLFGATNNALIECPSSTTQSATATIGIDGGTVSVGGTSVMFPAGALLAPATIQLTVPASRYVEIGVTVNGAEHATFAQPLVVSIDYSRCSRTNILASPLTAWNIDPASKALLEAMPSVDDKLLHVVTFTTLHFSGYALAD